MWFEQKSRIDALRNEFHVEHLNEINNLLKVARCDQKLIDLANKCILFYNKMTNKFQLKKFN